MGTSHIQAYTITTTPNCLMGFSMSCITFNRQGCTFSQLASLWHLAPCSLRHTECTASSLGVAVELSRTRLVGHLCVCMCSCVYMHIHACSYIVFSVMLETNLHCVECWNIVCINSCQYIYQNVGPLWGFSIWLFLAVCLISFQEFPMIFFL
jgi:hypothetical protein